MIPTLCRLCRAHFLPEIYLAKWVKACLPFLLLVDAEEDERHSVDGVATSALQNDAVKVKSVELDRSFSYGLDRLCAMTLPTGAVREG